MKKIFYILLAVTSLWGCSNDNDLSSNTVITEGGSDQAGGELNPQNDLDRFLNANFAQPYNIRVIYRFLEKETTRSWVLTPITYEKAVQMGNILKYLYMDPFVETTSRDFMREHSFNILILMGEYAYHPSRVPMRGLATNGVKIHLMNLNNIEPNNIFYLNDNVLRTLYHETAHTWHQTIDYPTEYKRISGVDYRNESWQDAFTERQSLQAGFISPYGGSAPDEDFVELIARYIIYFNATQDCNCATTDTTLDANGDGFDDALYTQWKASFANYNGGNNPSSYQSARVWEEQLARADGKIREDETYTGKQKLEQKLAIVRKYLTDNWNIDLDVLRRNIRSRYPAVAGRNLDGTPYTPQKDFNVLTNN